MSSAWKGGGLRYNVIGVFVLELSWGEAGEVVVSVVVGRKY
jgi:hypothetical protein